MKFLRYILPAAVLAVAMSAGNASADCYGYGIGNCSFGNLNAFGASGNLYGSGYLFVPPYFSIHPPVYYSHQYYRPYGWSPFAQSGNVVVAAPRPEPRMIVNPHVAVKEVKKAKPDNTAQAEMILNPFYVKASKSSQGQLAGPQR